MGSAVITSRTRRALATSGILTQTYDFEHGEGSRALTNLTEATPATDEELAEYAAECTSADPERCGACFVGPAIAGCASFLCRKDVGKLLARLSQLRAERDELQRALAVARAELDSRR